MPEPNRIHPPGAGRAGHNKTGKELDVGVCVVAGAVDSITLPAAADDPIWGISAVVIRDATRGDVQIAGVALVRAGAGGYVAGQRLMPEALTGRAVPFAPNANVNASLVGVALTTTPEGELGEVELAGAGASRRG